MATLVLDGNNTVNLVSQPMTRTSDQYISATSALRIVDDKPSDKVDNFSVSSNKPNVPLSSSVIMNSDNSQNQINNNNNIDVQTHSSTEPGDTKALHSIERYISETTKKKISGILTDVEKLNDIEKFYLYLQLPDGTSSIDDNEAKKKGLNTPFGKKADTEVIQTYTWIQSHLEEDISVSIPKHEVYEEYKAYCEANKFEKLCVADFGKAMKHIFPQVKPRRLGQRGNSKYCYSGLRKKILVDTPELPVLDTSEYKFGNDERELHKKNVLVDDIVWKVIHEWVEKTFNRKFKSYIDLARFLIETQNIKTDLASVFKSHEAKNNGLHKSLIPRASAKKNNSYNHLGKKINEKKKYDVNLKNLENQTSNGLNNNTSVPLNNNKVINPNFKPNSSQIIKTEFDETAFSPPNVKIVSKVPISCNSSVPSSPTIILLSRSQTVPKETLSNNVSTLNNSPTSQIGSTIKYKPIQPKPISLDLSRACPQTENNCFDGNVSLINIDKRRHSVSTPFNVESNNGDIESKELEEFKCFGSEVKISDNDKNYKRQMDEKDFQFMSKKRHVEDMSAVHGISGVVNCSENGLISNSIVKSTENSDLKVNEIETEALYDYLNTNVNSNPYENLNSNDMNGSSNGNLKSSLVQLRKMLENHLVNRNGTAMNHSRNVNTNNEPDSLQNYIDANSLNLLTKSNVDNSMQSNCLPVNFIDKNMPNNVPNVDVTNNSTVNSQIQIPPSPNARRQAFSFQPISPRNTPTIPENSALDINMFNHKNSFNNMNTHQYKQMTTVSVGPSQPSSEANSPFVSPRNTPISLGSVSRSRNNSGQSSFSNYRQTPLQNFDSGVSSISSSPFISPQSTPIPGSRMRSLDNPNMARNLVRVRHSSGPGGPINRSQISNVMIYNRSNSLSPMIGDGTNFFSSQNFVPSPSINNPISGNKFFNDDLVNKLSVVNQSNQTEQKPNIDQLSFDFSPQINNNPACSKALNRQRHFSNPYGGAPTMIKNEDSDDFKALLNRSQSVPLHQMFQSNIFDSNTSIDSQLNDYSGSNLMQSNDSSNLIPSLETISKYSATVPCNENFKLPQTTVGTVVTSAVNSTIQTNGMMSSTLEDLLTNNDSVIQSGQDLIVSSVQINQGITSTSVNESNQPSTIDDLNVPSPLILSKSDRDEFNDLLINDSDVEHFQSLDDFRDCDNDFSNIGLENHASAYDDDFIKFS